jgi:hypothetical protein
MSSENNHINWLAGLLTGWGIKECWAKLLAGAIIGALSAAGVLCASSCSADYRQCADGSVEYSSRIILPIRDTVGK